MVVDWLEKNSVSRLDKYPTKVNYFADSVCWENTLYSIERRDHPEGIVTEMVMSIPTCWMYGLSLVLAGS